MSSYQTYNCIREIFILLEVYSQQTMAEFELTTTQYDTLFHLRQDSGWRMSDLCEKALCDNSKMTRIIDYLESRGWAERRKNPEDRRSLWVYLTAEGETVRAKAKRAHTAVLDAHLAIFQTAEQQEFEDLLCRFRDHLINDDSSN